MKKILAVFNAGLFSLHLINTAVKMAKGTRSFLHIVLVNDTLDLEEEGYPFPNDLSLIRNQLTGKSIKEENAILMEKNLSLLLHYCQIEDILFYVDPDRALTLEKLIEYSNFSDLILADADENLRECYIDELLVNAHCPVFLSSATVTNPENIIFAYDGSSDCMHAIKAFSYLFAELKALPVFLLYIKEAEDMLLPNEDNVRTWLAAHYTNIQIPEISGNLQDELVSFTKSIPNTWVIMGSFGRNVLSRLLRKSLAKSLINEKQASVFIGHD